MSVATSGFEPACLRLLPSGELEQRVKIAWRHLEDCDLCARYCRVNRLQTVKGAVCRTGERAVVYSYGPHHGGAARAQSFILEKAISHREHRVHRETG